MEESCCSSLSEGEEAKTEEVEEEETVAEPLFDHD